MRVENLVGYISGQPWAMTDERWAGIEALIASVMSGEQLSEAEVKARLQAYQDDEAPQDRSGAARQGSIGVITIVGDIVPRASVFAEMFGLVTSCARLSAGIRQFSADPNVSTILLDIHSGGGSVIGGHEVFQEIMRAKAGGTKVIAHGDFIGSLAYWIASGATEIVGSESGQFGSIGVKHVHVDVSGALEKAGIKVTLIKAGKFKGEDEERIPFTKEAAAALQARADAYFDLFKRDVAMGRETTPSKVEAGYGQGRVLGAREAKAEGLIDRIATLPETIERLLGRKRGAVGARASVLEPELDDAPPPLVPPAPDPEPDELPRAAVDPALTEARADLVARRRELELLDLEG